jgi:cytochrome oxidase Cu insertion factor (SCO1/SenC/PrrC family)
MNTKKMSKKKFYLMMSGFLMIFALPMLSAWLLYQWDNHHAPVKTRNYGQLIQPPLDLSQLNLQTSDAHDQSQSRGKWLLLYVSPISYDPLCEDNLRKMRQIRIATGKDMQRVARAVLTFSHQPADNHLHQLLMTDYVGTVHFITDKQTFVHFIKPLSNAELVLQQGYLYLVDPLGNVMMAYESNTDSAPIYKDLTHLLNNSQIG